MSYRHELLVKKEPLEKREIADLKAWIKVLEGDIAFFGAAPSDIKLIERIRQKVKEATK